MLDPIVKSIDVPCGPQQAFDVFWKDMSAWWPLDKFTTSAMAGQPAKAIRVDARPGGEIVEIGGDDTETLWGVIEAFEPPSYVRTTFHFAPPGVVVEDRTLLEVRFTGIDGGRTRVELTQTNWEVLGDQAADIRGGYEFGWGVIFEKAYKAACGG
ncbi:MAG: SRPBCC domain-containing protein [Proteobacteria bacterium]|nr:SRPBCC domain-containing protein [Pseudomonadota bacterium]MDA1132721.1 SRPBCC domain-containing protein [Pseudomonadota bacterium]